MRCFVWVVRRLKRKKDIRKSRGFLWTGEGRRLRLYSPLPLHYTSTLFPFSQLASDPLFILQRIIYKVLCDLSLPVFLLIQPSVTLPRTSRISALPFFPWQFLQMFSSLLWKIQSHPHHPPIALTLTLLSCKFLFVLQILVLLILSLHFRLASNHLCMFLDSFT